MNLWSDLDEILGVAISAAVVDCLLNTICSKDKDQRLYLVIWRLQKILQFATESIVLELAILNFNDNPYFNAPIAHV